jgi:hypothetical protein
MEAPGANGNATPTELFESAFQDMALNQFLSRKPELAEQVASFKILEADPQSNTATGSIIIMRGDDEVHVPVVLTDNELMPFDTMYVRSLDMMLPLTEDWLVELDRMDTSNIGDSAAPPEFSQSDVDIRNIVVPPTTGRYSYASNGRLLPAYLAGAPHRVKTAFLATLAKYPKIAQYAFSVYDVNDLHEALHTQPRTKRASNLDGSLSFATAETPVTVLKSMFGADTPTAFKDITSKGYAARDDRRFAPIMVSTEHPIQLFEPTAPGFYYVYMADGEKKPAFIITDVMRASQDAPDTRPRPAYKWEKTRTQRGHVILFADGGLAFMIESFVVTPIGFQDVPTALTEMFTKPLAGTPRNGQRGVFASMNSSSVHAFEPVKIDTVYNANGARNVRGTLIDGTPVGLIQIPDSPVNEPKIIQASTSYERGRIVDGTSGFKTMRERAATADRSGEAVLKVIIPHTWAFQPVTEFIDHHEILRDSRAVTAMFFHSLSGSGAERIQIKSAGFGDYYINGALHCGASAPMHLAASYGVRVGDAESAIKEASARQGSVAEYFLVDPRNRKTAAVLVKMANPNAQMQDPSMMDPSMQDPSMMDPSMQDPSMMDPSMQDPSMMDPSMMDPSMMGPSMMGPPPPSPVELAAQEVANSLMEQNEQIQMQMQMQMQNLQTQMGAINAVTQRAHEIAAEMGVMPPSIAPVPMEMMMDPSMMDPSMGGAPQDMSGGMPVEEPGMMESAMELEDPELFDASAIASMASNGSVDQSVSTYTPALRDALDGVGRMLTEVRMKSAPLRQQIGDRSYSEIRDKLESLFHDMGSAITSLNSMSMPQDE